ncbi:MAG: GIY-YIG nuclease family protein [Phycisphaerae bacterium]|nr:GIY-YIG nuclease family protein [Phycisphaerae bacterium]
MGVSTEATGGSSPNARPDKAGYVYLLQRHDGWYRIGRTANPEQRFRQWRWMARNNHYTLKIITIIRTDDQRELEAFFHNLFKSKRTDERHNGMGPRHEWFKLAEEDVHTFYRWGEALGAISQADSKWRLS